MEHGEWFGLVFVYSQSTTIRLSGSALGHGASGGARNRDRRILADLRADSLATVPPTTGSYEKEEVVHDGEEKEKKNEKEKRNEKKMKKKKRRRRGRKQNEEEIVRGLESSSTSHSGTRNVLCCSSRGL
ncbi:hypothetical protein PoB_001190100 [Plakobranchus ocellatus]|uniref:Uncharacterized protein n=1 Tax=Plakobranchus ocellatus TaxID=259542 RepID=A0AAV3YQ17_9GAST|nr:hypothetical protein PoB_001190100 [Plakobranchus ocellatus]